MLKFMNDAAPAQKEAPARAPQNDQMVKGQLSKPQAGSTKITGARTMSAQATNAQGKSTQTTSALATNAKAVSAPENASARQRRPKEMSVTDWLFELIKCHGTDGITRAELSELSGTSLSSISTSVRTLLADGVIYERALSDGRVGANVKVIYLTPPSSPYWIAELGTNHVRLAVSLQGLTFEEIRELPLDLRIGPQATLRKIVAEFRNICQELDLPARPPAIGFAFPGPIDGRTRRLTGSSRLPEWNNFDITTFVRSLVDAPIFIRNDARAGAIGEVTWRARYKPKDASATDLNNVLYVKAGTGIGAAAIVNGKAMNGFQGFAGDISHARVDATAELPCGCGRTGCLETIASGAAIMRDLRAQGVDTNAISDLITLAEQWHPAVLNHIRTAGEELGKALAPVVTFLNPSAVIVGGSLSSIAAFMTGVRSQIYNESLPFVAENLSVEASLTKSDAALHGMLALMYRSTNKASTNKSSASKPSTNSNSRNSNGTNSTSTNTPRAQGPPDQRPTAQKPTAQQPKVHS